MDRIMDRAFHRDNRLADASPLTCGGSGIRTHEPFGPRLFKSLAFVRSAIPPMDQGIAAQVGRICERSDVTQASASLHAVSARARIAGP